MDWMDLLEGTRNRLEDMSNIAETAGLIAVSMDIQECVKNLDAVLDELRS